MKRLKQSDADFVRPRVTLYVSSVTLAQFSISQTSWGANPLNAASWSSPGHMYMFLMSISGGFDRFLTTKPGAGCHEIGRRPVHVAHVWVVTLRIEVAEVVGNLPWCSLVHGQLKDWVRCSRQVVLRFHKVEQGSVIWGLVPQDIFQVALKWTFQTLKYLHPIELPLVLGCFVNLNIGIITLVFRYQGVTTSRELPE